MGTIVVCHYSLSGCRVERGIRVLVNLLLFEYTKSSSPVKTILRMYLFIIFYI